MRRIQRSNFIRVESRVGNYVRNFLLNRQIIFEINQTVGRSYLLFHKTFSSQTCHNESKIEKADSVASRQNFTRIYYEKSMRKICHSVETQCIDLSFTSGEGFPGVNIN